MYNWGKDEELIPEDAGSIVDRPTRAQVKAKKLAYIDRATAPDTKAVLALAHAASVAGTARAGRYAGLRQKPFPSHVALMILVAGFCGLRQGELFELRGGDVDKDVLHVRRQVVALRGGGFRVTPPKYDSKRDTFVPVRVGTFPLRKMLAARAAAVGPDGLLFPAPNGGWNRRNNFHRDVFSPLRDMAWPGSQWVFHGLRHHFCRWHLDAGVSAADVADMAGHKDPSVTLTLYVSRNEGFAKRVAAKHRK